MPMIESATNWNELQWLIQDGRAGNDIDPDVFGRFTVNDLLELDAWAGVAEGTAASHPDNPKLQEYMRRSLRVIEELLSFGFGGLWLMTESAVIPGLKKAATFLLAVNLKDELVKGWGFWRGHAIGVEWIGPRHTNFNDGTICAFEAQDGTWCFGRSLVGLIDLYSVWALRHLHLELFGRWPGLQFVHHRCEHHLELHPDELCGCGTPKRYRDCCYEKDRADGSLASTIEYLCKIGSWDRKPPRSIIETVREGAAPPALASLKWR
jgi:hypothetical protein